tara:strand:- start:807 stop:1418 length:612 start_codon:yes stop_codon:yes gene_type:complete
MNKKFLHVGSGSLNKINATPEFALEYWDETRLDINKDVKPDVIASITDMSPIEDNSYDAVYSSHNIEHLYAHEVPIALKEMSRVLNDNGFLIITCPDIQSVCEKVAEGKLVQPLYQSGMGPITALDILYGLRSDIAKGNYYMAHKVGFTAQVLWKTIVNCNFKSSLIFQHKPSYVLWGIAYKSLDIKDDDMYIELKKHTTLIN